MLCHRGRYPPAGGHRLLRERPASAPRAGPCRPTRSSPPLLTKPPHAHPRTPPTAQFNAGSALASGYLSSRAFANTHLAAAAAMGGWAASEVAWGGPRFGKGTATAVGCATGVVVGLVAITPACGFVSQMFALLIGATASPVCYWAHRAVARMGVNDTLGCFPGHGVAGMFGILMTGLFASTDEGSPADGAVYGNPALLGKQAAALAAAIATCAVGTTAAYWLTAGVGAAVGATSLSFEDAGDGEELHVDMAELGETAYVFASGKGGGVGRERTHSLLTSLLARTAAVTAVNSGR